MLGYLQGTHWEYQKALDGHNNNSYAREAVDGPFGDIWCQFVSFGPAPHIYQRGERVGGPVCTIHGHCPESTWSSVRQGSMVPGNMPHPLCLHIDPAARSGTEGEPHPETRAVGAI